MTTGQEPYRSRPRGKSWSDLETAPNPPGRMPRAAGTGGGSGEGSLPREATPRVRQSENAVGEFHDREESGSTCLRSGIRSFKATWRERRPPAAEAEASLTRIPGVESSLEQHP